VSPRERGPSSYLAARFLESIESIKIISNCSKSPGETRLMYSGTAPDIAARLAATINP
jgi:hypothetical protein